MASRPCSLNQTLLVPPFGFASQSFSTSPVSWQVLIWALLSLGINLKAQPSGRIVPFIPSRFRLYLCSSPIICIADALSMIIQFVAIVANVRIAARTATLVIVYGRAENTDDVIKDHKNETGNYISAAWPGRLFFILGGLFPVIKLGSLSGVPWAQTLGCFFVSSIMVIEVFTFVAHDVLHSENAVRPPANTSTSRNPSMNMALLCEIATY
jgi:hypothetical protein